MYLDLEIVLREELPNVGIIINIMAFKVWCRYARELQEGETSVLPLV